MPWRVEIDQTACMGSGICAGMAPERFTLVGRHSTAPEGDAEEDEILLDAADSCPAGAITVTENGAEIGPRP